MTRFNAVRFAFEIAFLSLLYAVGLSAQAAQPRASTKAGEGREVEMFAAMQAGDIEVKLIPRNDREANVLVKNKTKQPLNVRLPEAFAGVPVLAQFNQGGNNNNNSNNNNQNQSFGGGFGGGGFGGGGFGGGGGGGGGGQGFFSVPAEKAKQVKVATVCLEHGKRDPKANVPYEIRPIEKYTSDAKVQELLKLLASGKVSQRAAQAAAWHLANQMTWDELASKRIKHVNGTSEPYFSLAEVRAAFELVQVAERLAGDRPSQNPSSTSTAPQL